MSFLQRNIEFLCVTTILLMGAFFLFSCSYSINCVHTQGRATDVVDEQQSASPNFDTKLSVPMSAI